MPDNRIQTTEVKKVKSRSKLLFIITIIAYLTALLIYSYWNYIYFNNELMETIDRELLISAVSLKYILPDDFHDRAIDEQSISIEEDKYNALKLSKLLKETGFKYIYTVIKKENKLFFITSDLTADPKSERGTWYYYPYEEADKSFYDAFTQNKPTYKNVSDQWGTVRTVMVPETSPGGIVYLACADYDISFVNETLQRNLLRSIAGILFFVLLAIPFFLIYRSIRRKHLNSLRESEEQQRTLINTVPDIIVKVNTEGIITFITENTFNLFPGMGTEDILGKNMFSFLARDDHQRAAENTLLMFERQLGPVEYRIGPSEDTLKDVEVNGDVMRDLNGNPTGMVYTIRDITDRKKSEEKLQKSEEKYRTILETMEEGYFEVDLAGTFTLVNNSLSNMLGYSKDELLGMNNRSYMDPATTASAYKIHGAIYETGRPRKYINYDINRKDGQKRTFEVSSALRLNNEGHPCGFSGVARDITERKKSRELMVQTEKMMSIGGLAAGMAHEINNPLGGMLQGVQNIQRRLSPDFKSNHKTARETGLDLQQLQPYLEKRGILSMLKGIQDSGFKAAQIVTNMLQFSRKSESSFAPTDLVILIERVIELAGNDYNLKNKYDFRNITILRDFDPDLPLVPCMETEIEQVILNLLINAASAMTSEKSNLPHQIRLVIRVEQKTVRIEVADNGPGIEKETLKRIFEPFFTTKPVGEGTGLGLSVSYMIIHNNHEGTMEVESEPGKGTKFIIRLPLEKN